jgi:NAD(P)-dependent dehydrogenase (short-subunit alcohol dehydrogenase family)
MIDESGARRDRVALVTGAGSGMGAACARRLASDHRALVLFDVHPEPLERVSADVQDAGAETAVVVGSVAEPGDVARAVRESVDRFGSLDVVVNAAGVAASTRFFDLTLDEWRRVLDVNLTGAFVVTHATAASMRDRGWGRIVHFSSTAGKTVSTLGGAHYTVSKHGVLGLVRSAAKELAPFGITVNAVCPGLIDTPMVQAFTTEVQRAAYARSFPISRLGEPEEVADLVAFLASDGAAYITGAAVDINGGDLMV